MWFYLYFNIGKIFTVLLWFYLGLESKKKIQFGEYWKLFIRTVEKAYLLQMSKCTWVIHIICFYFFLWLFLLLVFCKSYFITEELAPKSYNGIFANMLSISFARGFSMFFESNAKIWSIATCCWIFASSLCFLSVPLPYQLTCLHNILSCLNLSHIFFGLYSKLHGWYIMFNCSSLQLCSLTRGASECLLWRRHRKAAYHCPAGI